MMTHEQMLAFIHKQTKLAVDHVQHMDAGGTVLGGPAASYAGGVPNPNQGVIGTINNALGLNNNYQAGSAAIQAGTNANQLNQSYTGVQGGLGQQSDLTQQFQPGSTQGLYNQGQLAKQLVNESNGVGPNPAQAALNQSTGQNIEQEAALLASQRGAGANPGLAAEQAARAGGAIQQQSAGQAATLQAQQQIAAQQQLQGLAGQQVAQETGAVQGVNNAQQNEQGILQGANTAYNNTAVNQQSNINNVNSQTAQGNQNIFGKTVGALTGGASAVLGAFAHGGMVKMDKGGNVLDANARKHIAPENFALPGRRYPIHDINHARNALARVSQNGTPAEKSTVRSAVHKKYPDLAGKKMAQGGVVDGAEDEDDLEDQLPASQPQGIRYMAGGGYLTPTPLVVNPAGAQSFVGQWVNSPNGLASASPTIQATPGMPSDNITYQAGSQKKRGSQTDTSDEIAGGGSDNPSDISVDPNATGQDVYGNESGVTLNAYKGGLMEKGGGVKAHAPKEKAKVDGDSLKNDKVPAMLSEGEGVIDRETMSDPGPIGKIARALMEHIESKKKRTA